MRIAIVYDAVHPWVTGGGERRFHELATRLAADGDDVHWYGMRWWDGPRTIVRDGITYHGVCAARPLYTASGRRSIGAALVFGVACLRLLGARYDVVDCCGFPFFSLFSARLATWVRGGTLVSTWHEVWGAQYWREYLGALGVAGALVERVAARVPDHLVPVSPETGRRLRHDLGATQPITCIANGVDGERIAAVPAAQEGFDLVYAGRLCDFKDVELLLDAHAELLAERPGTTCGVIGDGPHRAALERHVAALGTGSAVTFTGRLPEQEDVYSLLKASGVFVLPSRREGFGIVVVEAHACGLPTVVASHPGNLATGLVEAGNGRVAAPEPRAVAAAAADLLAGRDAAARERVVASAQRFTWSSAASRYAAALGAAA